VVQKHGADQKPIVDTEMFTLGPDNQPIAANRVSDTIAGGYSQIPQKYYHPNPSRNALGLVGGNDVSIASGSLVDVESDLRGTTRDLSNVPSKKYQPYCPLGSSALQSTNPAALLASVQQECPPWPKQLVFTERATGKVRVVATGGRHLPTKQYVSYPGVPAPDQLKQDVYGWPWRF
jgi:hypothetical protein